MELEGIFYHPHLMSSLPASIKHNALTELGEDDKTREACLKELRAKLKGEENLSLPLRDSYLLIFLRRCKFQTTAAFNLILRFCRLKQNYPDLTEIKIYSDVLRLFSEQVFNIMPYRDKDGSLIVVQHIANWNTQTMPVELYIHTAYSYFLCILDSDEATQICGFKLIADLEGMSLSQVRQLTARYMWFTAKCLSGHFPIRVTEIHFCNEPPIFYYTWALLRQFMSTKMRKRVHFHSKNVEQLHRYVNPALLPEKLKGKIKYDSSFVSRMDEVMRPTYENQIKYGFRKKT